jgi:hypothetical protein
MMRAVARVLLPFLLVARPLAAQPAADTSDPAAVERFLAEAREGTARYRSQQAAVEDGFRRVGVDFPAMGEHWVSLGRAMSGDFVAGRPAMLTYVRVGGVPTLVGVGYIALLDSGERLPPFPPANGFWHEHNGSVAEESLPFRHHGGAPSASSGVRVSVLHAWIWAENPAGIFVTDNWTLPFVRLGVSASPDVSRDARHALSLSLDGEEYYASTMRAALTLSAGEANRVEGVIARYRSLAREALGAASHRTGLDPASVARLEALWAEMWAELGRTLPLRTRQLAALRDHL